MNNPTIFDPINRLKSTAPSENTSLIVRVKSSKTNQSNENSARNHIGIVAYQQRPTIILQFPFQRDTIYQGLWFAKREGREIGFEDWSWFDGGQGSSACIVPFARSRGRAC